MTTRITVSGETPYDVLVGRGLDTAVVDLVGPVARQVLVVHSRSMTDRATVTGTGLRAAGYDVSLAAVDDGEAAKRVDVAGALWSMLGRRAFTRSDAVVAVGGGATTDLAGFVAASWLRGVPVVHVPTTLLGMVDAAVGGKTGVNTDEGKNLVGAFHPPAGVVCDLDALATLPAADLASGLAEVVKAGFIRDPAILDVIEADPRTVLDPTSDALLEVVERSVRVKADVVGADLRERGGREVLNYGHTLGHAIEQVESYRWRHGDAVSVGLVFAAALARCAGRLDPATTERHAGVLGSLGLPTTYDAAAWPRLRAAMRVDKKSRGAMLRLVVLDGLARPGLLEDPDESLLERAYAEVSG